MAGLWTHPGPQGLLRPRLCRSPRPGDGAALEQTVRALLWLRAGELRRYTVVIADDGLDPLGRAVANALVSREPRVILCPMGALTEYLV